MNKTKKVLAVLSTAALFGTTPAAVVAPFVTATVAHAATGLQVGFTPSVSTNAYQNLGTLQVTVSAGAALSTGDTLVIALPDQVWLTDGSNGTTQSVVSVTAAAQFNGNANGFAPDQKDILVSATGGSASSFNVAFAGANSNLYVNGKQTTGYNRVLITPKTPITLANDSAFVIQLKNVWIGGVSDGPITAIVNASGSSPFPSGTVDLGIANGSGSVNVAAANTQTGNNSFSFLFDINEKIAGSFSSGKYIKLKLPNAYKWTVPSTTGATIQGAYGVPSILTYDVAVDGNTLTITSKTTTTSPGLWELPLTFTVDDESSAQPGDIVATVSGSATVNSTSLVVGTYGDYGVTVSAESSPNIIAGHKGQDIGNIVISESLAGSLVQGRTIELTLPDGVRWQDQVDGKSTAPGSDFDTSNGLTLNFVGYVGTDKRTAKWVVNTPSSGSKGGKITLKNAEVAVEPGFSGDLTVQVSGTAGASGSVTVGKVVAPVTASVSTVNDVVIGKSNQPVGDITITETIAGAFAKNSNVSGGNVVRLNLPSGVSWVGNPEVKVTSGDLRISNVNVNGSDITFTVEGESSQPSTITVTGAQLKVDRTVPEGPINLKIKGNSVALTSTLVPAWSSNDYALSFKVANVATPAPSTTTATFTVGSTTYTVNGVQKTMDVAPYLKNDGRVMLPVRFVANALGVDDNHIIWNGDDQSVTIFKGNTVVKLTVGSKTMIVNGVAVTMDVAPELYNDGRVMLPLRWVGQALGAQIDWNQDTQTVTVTAQE